MRASRLFLVATLATICVVVPARADEAHAPSVAVLETYGPGMPAASVQAVTRQLYATLARLGYRVTPETETARLTMRLGPHVLAPADLIVLALAAHADHALQATLTSQDTRYVVLLTLVDAKNTPAAPRYANAAVDAAGLELAAERLTRTLLPPIAPDVPAASEPVTTSLRLALQTEAAFGLSSHFFYNHFAGGRLDYGFTRDFALGAYVGYANLKGREGRVSEVLPYLQLEYRLPISDGGVLLPLRFGTGYLPKNGPFLRVAAGPSFPLGGTVRLGMDLLAPTFVIVHDRTVVSMDVAVELSFGI